MPFVDPFAPKGSATTTPKVTGTKFVDPFGSSAPQPAAAPQVAAPSLGQRIIGTAKAVAKAEIQGFKDFGSTVKEVGKAVIGSETKFGQDIATPVVANNPRVVAARKKAEEAAKIEQTVFKALVEKRNQLKKEGKSTTAIDKAIGEATGGISGADILNDAEKRTRLQVAGDAAGTLVDVLGVGSVASKTAKTLTTATKTATTLDKVLKYGKLAGEGAAAGYGMDVSQSMQEGQRTPGEILTPGINTAIGAAAPIALAGAGAGVSKLLSRQEFSQLTKLNDAEKIKPILQRLGVAGEDLESTSQAIAKSKDRKEITGIIENAKMREGSRAAALQAEMKTREDRALNAMDRSSAVDNIDPNDPRAKLKTQIAQKFEDKAARQASGTELPQSAVSRPQETPRATIKEKTTLPTPKPVEAVTEAPGAPTKVTPKLEQVSTTAERKTSGLAKGVEAKAVEKRLTEGFDGLPEYNTINKKDQGERAVKILNESWDDAKEIAMGRKVPPSDVLPEAVFTAVENRAAATGDVETLRELATASSLNTEASVMGQRIGLLAERNPDSPVSLMRDLAKKREATAAKRLGDISKARKTATAEVSAAIKKAAPTEKDWGAFVNSIKC